MNWYYALHGKQQGPVSDEELARLAATGVIAGATLVWKEGMADWQPLSTARPDLATVTAVASPQIGGVVVPAVQKDLVVQQMREGVITSSPGQMQFAGFWIRFVAKLIDWLALGAVFGVLFFVLFFSQFQKMMEAAQNNPNPTPEDMGINLGLQLGINVLSMAITAAYNGIMISKWGATLGKMALGLKVVTADGGPVSAGRAWGRAFAEIISGMVCYIGYIIAGFDDHKRSLHDHICSTRVIKTR